MTEKNKDTRVSTPDMTLNAMDWIYLAVAWCGAQGKPAPMALTHVYMLGCRRMDERHYSLNPEIKIATFSKARDAEIFYKTLLAAKKAQEIMKGAKMIMEMYEDEIEQFYQRVR